MNEIVSSNVADAIVKIVANQVLPALLPNLCIANLVARDWDDESANAGDTVAIPIAPEMEANNIAEAGTVKNQNPTLGSANIVLDRHVEASFSVPDVVKMLVKPDLVNVYMQSAVQAVATHIETSLFSLYPLLNATAPLGANNVDISEPLIDAAETALFNAKVPLAEPRYMVLSGNQYGAARQIDRFTETQTVGDAKAIVQGTVGDLKGFKILRSQLVPTVGGTTYNMAFARSAMGIATRHLPVPAAGLGVVGTYINANGVMVRVLMSYNPSTLSQQFTVDVLYGVAALRPTFGVQVQTK